MFWQLRNVSITRTLLPIPIHLESDEGRRAEETEKRGNA